MTPKQMIAHRGLWWPDAGQQNGLAACADAFAAGYSVEVDVRRGQDGSLVLSHDPVQSGNVRPLASLRNLLETAARFPASSVFIDVKEAGTVVDIMRELVRHEMHARAWLFDFELAAEEPPPGRTPRLLARRCDRVPSDDRLPGWASGWWVDQWDSDWVDPCWVACRQVAGAPVFVVSSELQGRPLNLHSVAGLEGVDGLCTDYPHLLSQLGDGFGPLHPADPWWEVRP